MLDYLIRLLLKVRTLWLRTIYFSRKKFLLKCRQLRLRLLKRRYNHKQLKDLAVCIEFRLRMMSGLFPKELQKSIAKYVHFCYRMRKVKELEKVLNIFYTKDYDSMQTQLFQLTKPEHRG